MKRALAERAAKQSSLPNPATKNHSLQQPPQQPPPHPESSSIDQLSSSSPELHPPPPMKIPRLHKQAALSSASSLSSFQHQTIADARQGGYGAGVGGVGTDAGLLQSSSLSRSSSSSLPVNHHNMHLAASSVATTGGGESTTTTTTTTTTARSYERHNDQNETTPSSAATTATKNKRQRNSIVQHHHNSNNNDHNEEEGEDEEDEETKTSGFYLKHQNKALATELSSLQAAVAELTAEREYRRKTCLEAVQALHSLQATWTSLEAALQGQQQLLLPPNLNQDASSSAVSAHHHDTRTPASTAGSTPETAVEWTVALHDALQALGSSSSIAANSCSSQNQPEGNGGTAAEDNNTNHKQNHQPPPPPPDPAVADLGRIAANVSSRANCLQEWIWKLLQSTPEERRRMGNNYHNINIDDDGDTTMNGNGDNENNQDTSNNSNNNNNFNNNAPLFWKHSCQRLETQVLELTQSRNQIAQRERKLRRNMYRLASGMMTQQQVLQQAIHADDATETEHEEFLAATAMAAAAAATAAAAASTNHGTMTTSAAGLAGGTINNSSDHSDRGGNSIGVDYSDAERVQATMLSSSSSSLPIKDEQGESVLQPPPQRDVSSSSLAMTEHVGSSSGAALTALASGSGDGGGGKFLSVAALDEMKIELHTARHQVLQGEQTIQELNATLQERELRINQLTTKQQSEEDAERLKLLEATTCKLDVANKIVTELEDKLNLLKTEWAQSAGNDQTLRESMKEMQDKHHKRWSELTSIWSTTSGAVVAPSTVGDDSTNSSKNNINGESASWQQQRQDESSNGDAATSITDAGDGLDATTSAAEAVALEAEHQERKIMELQHKLSQALENVRQAETARNNLKTALSMNTTLQGKLDDLKHKYATAVAAAAEHRSSSSSSANPNTNHSSSRSSNTSTDVSSIPSGSGGGGSSTPRERDSSSSSAVAAASSSSTNVTQERFDKMYRDNKKMKKEIAMMTASKEAHKAKIERVEKERDGLMDANTRLLKQITENDEMNAKSLSTILHLKSMTEHLNTERDNLEQQVKSASQLALASRLASNAKDRVSEEMLKEKSSIQEHLTELETTHAATKDELNRITLEMSQADGKEAAIRSELSNALQRCDELVSQVEEKRQEIRKLVAALDKAEQEAREANKKLAESAASAAAASSSDNKNSTQRRPSVGGAAGTGDGISSSNFTVEQLNTQISFLKGRLACPVCHYRDKQCIIMRCRHMHCKQCVEEQISNRSRKCPSCNGKFSEKDVEDIWLD